MMSIFNTNGFDPTQLTATNVLQLLLSVAQMALTVIGGIAVVYIIVAGIQYMTAAGDAKKQSDAKGAIQAAVIGLLIVALAFALTNTVLRGLQFNYTIIQDKALQPARDVLTTPAPVPKK